MKCVDNRQNKWIVTQAPTRPFNKEEPAVRKSFEDFPPAGIRSGGIVLGLVANLFLASKIVQTAKHCHLAVHHFDRAEALLKFAGQHVPILIILDWDDCEAEAFKLLKELARNTDLQHVPAVGYLSQAKALLKEEARRAGCHRVYGKTEFNRDLASLLTRYAQ